MVFIFFTMTRRQPRNAPTRRIRATMPRMTLRRTTRLRLGGGASRLIRSLERSGCAGEVIGRNLRGGRGEREVRVDREDRVERVERGEYLIPNAVRDLHCPTAMPE